jgi:hypothetical protein
MIYFAGKFLQGGFFQVRTQVAKGIPQRRTLWLFNIALENGPAINY